VESLFVIVTYYQTAYICYIFMCLFIMHLWHKLRVGTTFEVK